MFDSEYDTSVIAIAAHAKNPGVVTSTSVVAGSQFVITYACASISTVNDIPMSENEGDIRTFYTVHLWPWRSHYLLPIEIVCADHVTHHQATWD